MMENPLHRGLGLAALCALFACAAAGADTCDARAAKKNLQWAAGGHHSWLADVEHDQDVDLTSTWCRIFEASGIERVQKTIDFGRALFTGDGLHPSIGGIVPGSGFAGGLAYNLQRATAHPAIRYSGSVEARGSYNGFWEAGAKLDIWGSANRPEKRHLHATIDAEHYTLPQMTYFGEGNHSSLAAESRFGLEQTTAGGHLDYPLTAGFLLIGGLAGLWNSPSGVHGGSLPSIEQRFREADTPALATSTSYVVAGGGINWLYPLEPHPNGFSTLFSSGFKFFRETSGAPYSFRRLDVIWLNRYRPPTQVDLGAISASVRFVEAWATGGNRMPFYLQPTIGGTDIANVDMLRSYRDYRFRAPNALVFQVEYTRSIWGPLGVLGFYDTGRVAEQRSDIELAHLRHSLGAGLVVQLGSAPILKFYYAWGGHEGTHTTYMMNTNNFTFAAPSGVF